jgi:hypothetical protein
MYHSSLYTYECIVKFSAPHLYREEMKSTYTVQIGLQSTKQDKIVFALETIQVHDQEGYGNKNGKKMTKTSFCIYTRI